MNQIIIYLVFLTVFGIKTRFVHATAKRMECGGVFIENNTETFSYNGFLDQTDKSQICTWEFSVPVGYQIRLQILNFTVYKGSTKFIPRDFFDCSDKLTFEDSNGNSLNQVCNPISGSNNFAISKSNYIVLKFKMEKNEFFGPKKATFDISFTISDKMIQNGNICKKGFRCANNLICHNETCKCLEHQIFDPNVNFCIFKDEIDEYEEEDEVVEEHKEEDEVVEQHNKNDKYLGGIGALCKTNTDCEPNLFCDFANETENSFCKNDTNSKYDDPNELKFVNNNAGLVKSIFNEYWMAFVIGLCVFLIVLGVIICFCCEVCKKNKKKENGNVFKHCELSDI